MKRAITFSLLAASLMSFIAIDIAAAGKGTDNRAPAPRAATATTTRVSPHIDVMNQNKAPLGKKTDEPCGRHCTRPHHQHDQH